jgi:pimeloyl-ACP methyl ester carboxylesterase
VPRSLPAEAAWKSNWQNERARLMWRYAPEPILRQLKVPVLAFWGSEDPEALPSVEKPLLEQALREAGNRNYSLRVVTGGGHGLWVGRSEAERLGYAPEYLSGMLTWLRDNVQRGQVR